MTCREKGCYLSCKFLDLCLSKVHRSIQCCCMIICTVFKPSFWQRGLCREQWSCGGTGVGDTAQFWLTVSQYVEWGSMRCEVTGPLLPPPQMIPGTPFLPSPVTEGGGGERKKKSSQASTTPTRKMLLKCHWHSATMAACDSCLNVTVFTFHSLRVTTSKNINVIMNVFDKPLRHEEHPGEGWAICSEKWIIGAVSHNEASCFSALAFPPHTQSLTTAWDVHS